MEKPYLYIIDDDFSQKLAGLKKSLRTRMNGETSAQMGRRDIAYALNYGVSLPHLKEMAARCNYTPDDCAKLWLTNIREAMLLAAMLLPTSDARADDMLRWASQIKTPDMAEQSAFLLFARTDDLDLFGQKLLQSGAPFAAATAYFSIGHALRAGRNIAQQTAETLIAHASANTQPTAAEARGVSLMLRQLAHIEAFAPLVTNIVATAADTQNDNARQMLFEVQNEIEYLQEEKKLQ